jgi:hypothetical protein
MPEEVTERYLEVRAKPLLPLNAHPHQLYERAGYDLVIDYGQAAEPPLRSGDATWAASLIQSE